MKALRHLDRREWSQLFSSVLPPKVDFKRYQRKTGETVYLFTHPALGILGRLSVIPQFKEAQLLWEPVGHYLQPFIENLLEKVIPILRSPLERHFLPCSSCGFTIGYLLHFPTVYDLNLLKSCASYHYPNDFYLPTWIMGKDIALETLWPMRRIFRAITIEELAKSFLEFEAGHCSRH